MPFSPLVDWEYLLITIYIDTKLIRWFFFGLNFFTVYQYCYLVICIS